MWSGHFNFFFFVFFLFSKDWRVLLWRLGTSLGTYLPEVVLLLREYMRREMFDGDKLSSRLRWEMVPFSCTRYIPMHES